MEEPKEEEERAKLRGSEGREFGRRNGWEGRGAATAEVDSGTAVKLPARVAGRSSVCIAAGDEGRGESPFAFYDLFLFCLFYFSLFGNPRLSNFVIRGPTFCWAWASLLIHFRFPIGPFNWITDHGVSKSLAVAFCTQYFFIPPHNLTKYYSLSYYFWKDMLNEPFRLCDLENKIVF